jgi:hypothetical protein
MRPATCCRVRESIIGIFNCLRNIRITESTRFEIRAESYKLFNRTQILSPSASIPDINDGPSVFAYVLSDNGAAREIQLARKFYF